MLDSQFNLHEYFYRNNKNRTGRGLFPKIECVDGFTISVQASRSHHCSPREDWDDISPDYQQYDKVECGDPSEEPTIFKKVYESEIVYQSYAEKGVYPYIPVEVVEELINLHRGLV